MIKGMHAMFYSSKADTLRMFFKDNASRNVVDATVLRSARIIPTGTSATNA